VRAFVGVRLEHIPNEFAAEYKTMSVSAWDMLIFHNDIM
jgi:hypothetical protein